MGQTKRLFEEQRERERYEDEKKMKDADYCYQEFLDQLSLHEKETSTNKSKSNGNQRNK